jgi:hypothetical protein
LNAAARATALLLLCTAGGSCGKALVPGTTYAQPLFVVQGTINPKGALGAAIDPTSGPGRPPIVTLLWTDPLQRRSDLPAPEWSIHSSMNPDDDTYTLEIFHPPPPEALSDIVNPSGGVSRMALAEIVIVDDQDGDGTFRVTGARAAIVAPDRYLGGSANVLTYVERPFPSQQVAFPLTAAGGAGFGIVRYQCQGRVSTGTVDVWPHLNELVVHGSAFLPEIRTCKRTHSP